MALEKDLTSYIGLMARIFRELLSLSRSDVANRLKDRPEEQQLSPAYLAEVEVGTKKGSIKVAEKIAAALEIEVSDLFTLPRELQSLLALPFDLYGKSEEDVLRLIRKAPMTALAVARAMQDVLDAYGWTAHEAPELMLRTYQEKQDEGEWVWGKTVQEIEKEAKTACKELKKFGWTKNLPVDRTVEILEDYLKNELKYEIRIIPDSMPHCARSKSTFIDGDLPVLLLNSRMVPAQKAMVFARELGYKKLGLWNQGPKVNPPPRTTSYNELDASSRATTFGGALLCPRDPLKDKLEKIFEKYHWNRKDFEDDFLDLMGWLRPEVFYYRFVHALHALDIKQLSYHRFTYSIQHEQPMTEDLVYKMFGPLRIDKALGLSNLPPVRRLGTDEIRCRLWGGPVAIRLFLDKYGLDFESKPEARIVHLQRSRTVGLKFDQNTAPYFLVVSVAYPLIVPEKTVAAASIAIRMDKDNTFDEKIRFASHPDIPTQVVALSCQRCRKEGCGERRSEAYILHRYSDKKGQEEEIRKFEEKMRGNNRA